MINYSERELSTDCDGSTRLHPESVEKGVSRFKALNQLTSSHKGIANRFGLSQVATIANRKARIAFFFLGSSRSSDRIRLVVILGHTSGGRNISTLHERVPQHALTLGKKDSIERD